MPGHLSELPPVNAVNRKGQFFRASFGKNPRFQIQLDKRPLSPGMAQMVKNLPARQETQVQSLNQEDLLKKAIAPQSSILAWRIP